jgi:hypothetical protein
MEPNTGEIRCIFEYHLQDVEQNHDTMNAKLVCVRVTTENCIHQEGQRRSAMVWSKIFCPPICYLRKQRSKHTEPKFWLLCYTGVKLGLSHSDWEQGCKGTGRSNIQFWEKFLYTLCFSLCMTVRWTPPQRYPYFDIVVALVWSHDPKSYAGSSICYW